MIKYLIQKYDKEYFLTITTLTLCLCYNWIGSMIIFVDFRISANVSVYIGYVCTLLSKV